MLDAESASNNRPVGSKALESINKGMLDFGGPGKGPVAGKAPQLLVNVQGVPKQMTAF